MARLGVLALQGGYDAHARTLRGLGHTVDEVRTADDLARVDGLVLPGGESTTHLILIDRFALEAPLRAFVASGKPVLATCCGLILSAAEVVSPAQRSFGWVDVTVARNAWGRQVHSFEDTADPESPVGPVSMLFIRAPRITRVGPAVEVRATYRGEPVLVRQGNVTAGAFHPELTADARVHEAVFGRG
ncbi:pyridoxal 5'-phosphate synthase glutaminase subunit PdxT [Myxococcota bacterium]|nr:pyridoxal 5'-phosphate synthase glutaminase subunit PdxT [Myxococcota bacterium]